MADSNGIDGRQHGRWIPGVDQVDQALPWISPLQFLRITLLVIRSMRTNLNAQSRGSDSKFDVFLCSCHAHGGWRRLCSRNHSPHMESERQQPASIPHAVSKNSQFKICQSPAMVQLIKQLSHDLILTLSNYKELSTFRI